MGDQTNFIDDFSVTSLYMEMFFNDLSLSQGTCFVYEYSDEQYLVTNWHNLSGRNSITLKCLSKTLAIPNKIKIQKFSIDNPAIQDVIEIEVASREDGKPLWWEHPKLGHRVDVAVLPLKSSTLSQFYSINKAINICDYIQSRIPEVGEDVFILGYPFGLSGAGKFPIWKKASIASEPCLDIEDLPYILVDTASRPGMSGSPVIYRERRAVAVIGKEKSTHHHANFVGVYSGRIGAEDELKIQLGRVWKAYCVEEIINGKCLGKATY